MKRNPRRVVRAPGSCRNIIARSSICWSSGALPLPRPAVRLNKAAKFAIILRYAFI